MISVRKMDKVKDSTPWVDGNVHNDEENVDCGKCDSTIIGRTSDPDAMSEHNHKKLTKLKRKMQ